MPEAVKATPVATHGRLRRRGVDRDAGGAGDLLPEPQRPCDAVGPTRSGGSLVTATLAVVALSRIFIVTFVLELVESVCPAVREDRLRGWRGCGRTVARSAFALHLVEERHGIVRTAAEEVLDFGPKAVALSVEKPEGF